jgi:uncharacterized membrane protein YfcA
MTSMIFGGLLGAAAAGVAHRYVRSEWAAMALGAVGAIAGIAVGSRVAPR